MIEFPRETFWLPLVGGSVQAESSVDGVEKKIKVRCECLRWYQINAMNALPTRT